MLVESEEFARCVAAFERIIMLVESEEFARCVAAFERRERKYFPINSLAKTRRKDTVLTPGKGFYVDSAVNERFMTWRACWEYLTE